MDIYGVAVTAARCNNAVKEPPHIAPHHDKAKTRRATMLRTPFIRPRSLIHCSLEIIIMA